jgi:hypothetical protein
LTFISKEFILLIDEKNVITLTDEGDEEIIDLSLLEELFFKNKEILLKFRNTSGCAIGCTLKYGSNHYAHEYYSMDELLNDDDFTGLYNSLLNRFIELSKQSMVGGFIFDIEGYTDDFVNLE